MGLFRILAVQVVRSGQTGYILKEPADFGDVLIVGYQKWEDNQSR